MLMAAFDTRQSAWMPSSPGNDSCTAASDFVLVVNQKGKQAMTSPYRIAVIPGDGMGTEVMPDGLRLRVRAFRLRVRGLLHRTRTNAARQLV